MIILDTNIWVAYAYQQDSQHAKANQLMQNIPTPIVLPEYVLMETCTVLTARAGKSTTDIFLDRTLNNQDITLLYAHDDFFRNVLTQFQTSIIHHLSFIDISLLFLSQTYTVHTFDQDLARAIKRQASS
ncbi:MAG: PIN domain-containing protein [Patescibacteria group bacterium]